MDAPYEGKAGVVGVRSYGPGQDGYDLDEVRTEQTANGESAMKLAILGIDLAKSVSICTALMRVGANA